MAHHKCMHCKKRWSLCRCDEERPENIKAIVKIKADRERRAKERENNGS